MELSWLKELPKRSRASQEEERDRCVKLSNKFYNSMLSDLRDPRSDLVQRMQMAADKGKQEIEIERPRLYSSPVYRKVWECVYSNSKELNSKLKEDLSDQIQLKATYHEGGAGDWFDVLYLSWRK